MFLTRILYSWEENSIQDEVIVFLFPLQLSDYDGECIQVECGATHIKETGGGKKKKKKDEGVKVYFVHVKSEVNLIFSNAPPAF